VRLEEGVLLGGARLELAPVAVEDVLSCLDQLPGALHRALVEGVRVGHQLRLR
jgi:hypothetical protein